jgi:hypothetical protein
MGVVILGHLRFTFLAPWGQPERGPGGESGMLVGGGPPPWPLQPKASWDGAILLAHVAYYSTTLWPLHPNFWGIMEQLCAAHEE